MSADVATNLTPHALGVCGSCEQLAPAVFCGPCQNSKYCSTCDTQVHKLKNKCGHQRTPLGVKGSVETTEYFCPVHPGKVVEMFCMVCKAVICILCRDFDSRHAGHAVCGLADAAIGVREAVQANTAARADALKDLSNKAKLIEDMAITVASSGRDNARQAINNAFDQLEAVVRSRQAAQRQAVDDAVERHHSMLVDQQDKLKARVEFGVECTEKGNHLVSAPAGELAHGFKSCSRALVSIIESSPVPPEPVCDTAVPFSANYSEVAVGMAVFGDIDGAQSIQVHVTESGTLTLHWIAPSGAWVPPLYRIRLEVVGMAEDSGTGNNKCTGYERTVTEVYTPPSYAESTPCSIDICARDLCGCKVLFSIQGYEGMRCTPWIAAGGPVAIPPVFVRRQFVSNGTAFDREGLLYWIGTAEGTREFENPVERGDIRIHLSSQAKGSSPTSVCASQLPPIGESVFTENEQNACLLVDIGAGRFLRPTAYCLRHDMQSPRGVLRYWMLQGSVEDTDEDEWVTLSTHVNDTSLRAEVGATAIFTLREESTVAYRYFRLVQTGPNSNGKGRLHCCGIDFYGDLC